MLDALVTREHRFFLYQHDFIRIFFVVEKVLGFSIIIFFFGKSISFLYKVLFYFKKSIRFQMHIVNVWI